MEAPNGHEETAQEQPRRRGADAYLLLHDLVYILVAVTLLFTFAIRMVGVSGPSMTPTLLNGDNVALLSNFFYHEVEAGDVVVMRIPSFDDQPIVKRVIAKGGQTVDIDFEAGVVYVDGKALEEDYINDLTHLNYADGLSYPVTVPEGCLFVMGDNRNESADSRYGPIGLADERYVLGKVLAIVWPLGRLGLLK